MASLIPGYEYDIFISYRQKDNKYNGWVTEFVDHLKAELESTFKDDISVYFDINPNDGLLETHDVDASLREKLKCLIFIPIVSRTYCDPKSFAWEHEFKAFVEQAYSDSFGLKVKLTGGNVSSRVLPVYIHDLDAEDIHEFESVLGGFLRGVEFIYKEPGVDKPLVSGDDDKKNMNHTSYRIQIVKVAHAIKDILSGIKKVAVVSIPVEKKTLPFEDKPLMKLKSIIVLPFENISPDPEQEYFSYGLTEEIITDLSHIHDLLVISRNSAMTFKGTNKKTGEIAREVNVKYVLEGSVRKAGNNLRITAQLIDGVNDIHVWAEKYAGTLDDIFYIQEKVSRSIADSLDVVFSSEEGKLIKSHPPKDNYAYECLLKARHGIWLGDESSIIRAIGYLDEATEKIGENIEILSAQAEAYFMLPHVIGKDFEEAINLIERNVNKILKIDPDSAYGHLYQGLAYTKRDWGIRKAMKCLKQAFDLNPKDPTVLMMNGLLCQTGYPEKALYYSDKLLEIDPVSLITKVNRAYILLFTGDFESSKKLIREVLNIDPKNSYYAAFGALIFANTGEREEALRIISGLHFLPNDNFNVMAHIYGCALHDNVHKMSAILSQQYKQTAEWDETYSWALAQCFACVDNFSDSLFWLENAMRKGFINYPYLNEIDPFIGKMQKDERFKKLMELVKHEWENFELLDD